jgi:hypothetical protein
MSVNRWRAALTSKGSADANCRLTPAQVAELDAGPAVRGYADRCWTLARAADHVWHRFGDEYTLAGTAVLLYRIRW